MSENTTNDKILPAVLEEESVISEDSADKIQTLIDEIKKPTATEVTAEQFGIKVSKPKAMPETDVNNVIGSSETTKVGGPKKGNISVDNTTGILSSKSANRKDPVKEPAKTNKKVAIYSSRNVTMNGVGKVYRGYNIVTEEQAEVWLKRDHVRLATPEEVAQEFGK